MPSRHTLFRIFYRIGFTPWDGHPIGNSLRNLVEGSGDAPALPPGSALDLGCGTGEPSVYLAQHGWTVTGVDFVGKPLDKARVRANAAKVSVNFVQASVTELTQAGIGGGFDLIVDNGCIHAMSDRDRDAYAREVSAVAAPDAQLLIVAFPPGSRIGVPGIDQAELERRLAAHWTLSSTGVEQELDGHSTTRYYVFQVR